MVLVTCYQESQAALPVSASLPGAQGEDSHQTEGGLVFPKEHFGTRVAWAAWCRGAACSARAASRLNSDQEENRLSSHVLWAPSVTNPFSCAKQLDQRQRLRRWHSKTSGLLMASRLFDSSCESCFLNPVSSPAWKFCPSAERRPGEQ